VARGLRKLYPYLTTAGEVFHPDPSVTSFFTGGVKRYDGIDSGLSTVSISRCYFTIRDVLLRNAPVGRIVDVLRHDALYVHPERLVTSSRIMTCRGRQRGRQFSSKAKAGVWTDD